MGLDILPTLRPGQVPTAEEWNALVAFVSGAANAYATAPGAVGDGISITGAGVRGFQVQDGRAREHWAKIGAGSGAAYAHGQAIPDGAGGFEDLPASEYRIYGTASHFPARERSGRTDVPTGAYVRLFPDPVEGAGFLFDYWGQPGDSGTGSCSGLGWLAALRQTHCLRATILGDDEQAVTLSSDDGATWTVDDFLAVCGIDYIPTLDVTDPLHPTLTLVAGGTGSGEFSYEGQLDCSGCNYLVFAFSRYALCPCATPLPGGPCANLVRVKVEWIQSCSTLEMPCVDPPYEAPVPLYARFTGELSWLGCVALDQVFPGGATLYHDYPVTVIGNVATGPRDPNNPRFQVMSISMTSAAGSWCTAQVLVQGLLWAAEGELPGAAAVGLSMGVAEGQQPVTLDPFEVSGDFTTVHAALIALGYTVEGSAVTVTEAECTGAAPIPGYDGPGWYIVSGTDTPRYLDDESGCNPNFVIRCGPYETSAEAADAADDEGCEDIPCVPIFGWDGPGWYCVVDGSSCVAVELLEEDECNTDISICSGAYVDESTATAACGSVDPPVGGIESCCSGRATPTGGTVAVTSAGGGCTGVFTAATLGSPFTFPSGVLWISTALAEIEGVQYTATVTCSSGVWTASIPAGGSDGVFVSANCDSSGNVVVVFDFTLAGPLPCAGTVRLTFTLTGP